VFSEIEKGRARSTATGIIRTISTICTYAAEDGVYRGANIAENPSRILRQDNGSKAIEDDQIDRMDREESEHFLKVVKKHFGPHYPIFLTALRTGARQGELIGLAWDAVDWKGRFITIKQTIVNNKVQSTKNRQSRRIPLTPKLYRVLMTHKKAMSNKALTNGKPVSPWVFPGHGLADGPVEVAEGICSGMDSVWNANGDANESGNIVPAVKFDA
jgi:integrase